MFYDFEKAVQASIKFHEDFSPDDQIGGHFMPGRAFDIFDYWWPEIWERMYHIPIFTMDGPGTRASGAEEMLVGQKLNHEFVEAAAKVALKPAILLDNTDMGHSYRNQMARV
jgi:hypothetical protein